MQWGALPRFDRVVCGKSAYLPKLCVNADIPSAASAFKRAFGPSAATEPVLQRLRQGRLRLWIRTDAPY
jgi:hypothetical protein